LREWDGGVDCFRQAILVDSSVWIDYFLGMQTSQTDRLYALLGNEPVATGHLVLAEVLQGFGSARDFNQAKKLLTSLPIIELVGEDIAIQAAENFRALRSLGITVRKTIDTLIATSCIEKGLLLLYSDKDFDPFVEHLGLQTALSRA
jgi:predicted nucleic acid-binding protein